MNIILIEKQPYNQSIILRKMYSLKMGKCNYNQRPSYSYFEKCTTLEKKIFYFFSLCKLWNVFLKIYFR